VDCVRSLWSRDPAEDEHNPLYSTRQTAASSARSLELRNYSLRVIDSQGFLPWLNRETVPNILAPGRVLVDFAGFDIREIENFVHLTESFLWF